MPPSTTYKAMIKRSSPSRRQMVTEVVYTFRQERLRRNTSIYTFALFTSHTHSFPSHHSRPATRIFGKATLRWARARRGFLYYVSSRALSEAACILITLRHHLRHWSLLLLVSTFGK